LLFSGALLCNCQGCHPERKLFPLDQDVLLDLARITSDLKQPVDCASLHFCFEVLLTETIAIKSPTKKAGHIITAINQMIGVLKM
jgi:hypothetical protein